MAATWFESISFRGRSSFDARRELRTSDNDVFVYSNWIVALPLPVIHPLICLDCNYSGEIELIAKFYLDFKFSSN